MKMLKSTCLRPTHTLRRQLFVAFGVTSTTAIAAVTLIATISVKSSGENVKSLARDGLTVQVTDNLAASSRYVAETITKKFEYFGSAASLMVEATRDRFAGYPNGTGYADDSAVPFRDSETGKNKYPLRSPSLPLDWQTKTNINIENRDEHLQGRFEWYSSDYPMLSTASASYWMQGQCDPNVTDPDEKAYYPGCSDDNNNVTTGGAVRPTPTNARIYEKASDLNFILKPLYEAHDDVKILGIFFANSGAGSSVTFPSVGIDGTQNYTSIGCDWMRETNPFTRHPYATEEEISRCHSQGTVVTGREYNALERGWCRDQALSPFRTNSTGPYLDAWSDKLWLLTFGRAIFDRVTNAFIGCTLIDISIERIVAIVQEVKVGETSNVALLRWNDEGTIVASTMWDPDKNTKTARITDVGMGMGIDADTFLEMRSFVNFDAYWTPEKVRAQYRDKIYHHNGKMISMFPIPVPQEYDETYSPEFMVLVSIDEREVYGEVDEMDQLINHDCARLIRNTLIVGFVGLAIVWLIIWVDSRILTAPLLWMKKASSQIVKNAGGNLGKNIDLGDDPTLRWAPKTELNALVREFRKMVCGFSGDGAARVAEADISEVKNPFTLNDEFHDLYEKSKKRQYNLQQAERRRQNNHVTEGQDVCLHVPVDEAQDQDQLDYASDEKAPSRLNLGQNIPAPSQPAASGNAKDNVLSEKTGIISSSLFWWIMVSIVSPLMATMVVVCTLVTVDIKQAIPQWLEDVEGSSVQLERNAIVTGSELRASFAKEVMARPVRDLHLYSRLVGWLLFDGIVRSDGFTEMTTGVQECKDVPADGTCDYILRETSQCADGFDRVLQKRFYAGQSLGADPVTGARSSTSFPEVAFSPDSTEWWDSFGMMPGSEHNWSASGYETTYDRTRVLSALSVVEMPLFNYAETGKHLGSYVGYEADGLFMGYAGCDFSHAEQAHWVSSLENGAAGIRPELCPLDRYGFDCRCREWYDTGRKQALTERGSPIYITPPYVFSNSDLVASSITSALINPVTQEHVGQALLDFLPGDLMAALLPKNTAIGQGKGGFAVVITPGVGHLGGDTVVAPGFKLSGASTAIGDMVLPHDDTKSSNRNSFDKTVVADMKAGNVNTSTFKRKTKEDTEEWVYIAYAPVTVRALRPVYPRNFGSGVDSHETLVYSVGIAIPESDLVLPFIEIEDEVNNEIRVSTAILTALIVIASVLSALMAYWMTISLARPILALLRVVVNINDKRIKDDFPDIDGGSREVSEVALAFEKLFKVVRFSLSAFLSGDLVKAVEILREALELFNLLDNKKAKGIANNNLANTFVGMYDEMRAKNTDYLFRMNIGDVCHMAKQHYDVAIQLGEQDLEICDAEDKYNRAMFQKQLANRHFNRGTFLLSIRNTEILLDSETCGRLGCDDLMEAKRLDEVVSRYLVSRGTETDQEAIQFIPFDSMLGRTKGLLKLARDHAIEDVDDIWCIQELIENAKTELELLSQDDPSSLMFQKLGLTGRRQQLESLQIENASRAGNTEEAAIIAIRMLVEDEYIEVEAAMNALRSLLRHAETLNEGSNTDAVETIRSLLESIGVSRIHPLSVSKNVFFCLDYSGSMAGGRISRANKNMLKIYGEHCTENDYVGFVRFNHEVDSKLTFSLEKKKSNSHRHLTIMGAATNAGGGTNFYSALQHVANAIIRSPNHENNDSWIVALTDGASHDSHHEVKRNIEIHNDTCSTNINVIIIGFEVSSSVVKICKDMCTVSDDSLYIDARGGLDEMDKAFDRAAEIIDGGGPTMEMF